MEVTASLIKLLRTRALMPLIFLKLQDDTSFNRASLDLMVCIVLKNSSASAFMKSKEFTILFTLSVGSSPSTIKIETC